MTKRALKRIVREGVLDTAQFQEDSKVRRLPTATGWSPIAEREPEREQG